MKSVVVLLVLSVLTSLAIGAARTLTRPLVPSRTEVFGRRIAPLQSSLPTRGVVGYLADPTLPFNRRLWQFYQIQYFVAPLLVDLSADHDTLIGNFPRGVAPDLLAKQGFAVSRDFGNGILILTRRRGTP